MYKAQIHKFMYGIGNNHCPGLYVINFKYIVSPNSRIDLYYAKVVEYIMSGIHVLEIQYLTKVNVNSDGNGSTSESEIS